jgi:hypothetical protein
MTWVATAVAGASAIAGGSQANEAQGQANAAGRMAELREREREQQIKRTTAAIDAIFDSPERQRQYTDFVSSLRAYQGEQLERQKSDADRDLKFSLARSGQTGGSVAADKGRRLGDEFSDATLEAERRAQGALSDLQASDQDARMNLIQLGQSGLDTTTGAQRAGELLSANLGTAASRARAESLGDSFADTSGFVRERREEHGRRRGLGYDLARQDIYGG